MEHLPKINDSEIQYSLENKKFEPDKIQIWQVLTGRCRREQYII
jgi:hypothetical protein